MQEAQKPLERAPAISLQSPLSEDYAKFAIEKIRENAREALEILVAARNAFKLAKKEGFDVTKTEFSKNLSEIAASPGKIKHASSLFSVQDGVYSVRLETGKSIKTFTLLVNDKATELSYMLNGKLIETISQAGDEITYSKKKT